MFSEGRYHTYYWCCTLVDDWTSMFDIEMAPWVPIPANKAALHRSEDLIEAVNNICSMDCRCITYVHPEACNAFKALNASCLPNNMEMHPLHVYNISKEEEAALVAGLDGSEVVYKF